MVFPGTYFGKSSMLSLRDMYVMYVYSVYVLGKNFLFVFECMEKHIVIWINRNIEKRTRDRKDICTYTLSYMATNILNTEIHIHPYHPLLYSYLYACVCVCVFRMSIRVERNGLEKKRKTSFWINTDHIIVIGPFHSINMYVNVRVASVIALQPFYNHHHGPG